MNDRWRCATPFSMRVRIRESTFFFMLAAPAQQQQQQHKHHAERPHGERRTMMSRLMQ